MPNWMRFAAGWLLAATFALALSWGAVALVRNRVIQPTFQLPATATSAPGETPEVQTTSSEQTVIRIEPEAIDTSDSTFQAAGSSTTTPSDVGATPPSATSTPTTAPPSATTPATQPSRTESTTTTAPSPEPTTTTTVAFQTQTSSYTLAGGVVTISHSPGVVVFVSAIPQPGYSTDRRELGPDRVRIRFESENHTSDFRAEWDDGDLKITKNETGD